MKKTVVIHQPDFVPYTGFFHRFLRADLYVVLDHVQFVYGSRAWTHRDKIKTPQGEKWLSISVKKAPRDTAINKIELSTKTDWRTNNLNVIEANYRAAPFYSEILPSIEALYAIPYKMLSDFNLASITLLMDMLDVNTPLILSSSLNPQGVKNDLMIDLLNKVGATHYMSGVGAKAYLDPELFEKFNIQLVWQNFEQPIYHQLFGDFIPYLSTLDMLFNCGIEESRKLLRES